MSDKNKVATFTIKYGTYGSREIPKIFQFVLIFARKILLLLKTLIHHFAKVMSHVSHTNIVCQKSFACLLQDGSTSYLFFLESKKFFFVFLEPDNCTEFIV